MTHRNIPLDQLRFGHEANPPINARKVGRQAELASLAASIVAHGLGQALNVREIGGVFYVADGNRRLAALKSLADAGTIAADTGIKCDTMIAGDAGEFSLAMNIEREPMHEADQYEKFFELLDGGLTANDIASRFGIEPKRVRRILALGALSPVILQAWRDGEFTRDATDIVRAFTLAATVQDQEAVFHKLKERGDLFGHRIRQELGGGDRNSALYVSFVGIEAYQQAGGYITEDLFGVNHIVSDAALAKRLAEEKIVAKREELKADGWSWVEMADDLPYSWSYSWEKLNLGKKAATAEQKSSTGCVLKFTVHGQLEITYGVSKPKAPKAQPKKTADGAPAPTVISDALMQRLSVQLTHAAKDAITTNPKTALAAVIAGMIGHQIYGGVPIRIRAEGILKEPRRDEEGFEALFSRLVAMPLDDLLLALASEARFALDLSSHNNLAPPLGKPVNACFVDALDVDAMQAALRERFDAEDYFQSAPKVFAIVAIRDAVGDGQARAAEKMKKAELVKFALANVVPTGWLPPELRTTNYAGPVACAEVAVEPAAKSPKKPKKTPAKEAA